MGGADIFCSLTGIGCLSEGDELLTELQECLEEMGDGAQEIPPKILESLKIPAEDVEASSDYTMLTPYEERDGEKVLLCSFENAGLVVGADDLPRPTECTEKNITIAFDVRPGDNPDLGDYRSADESESYDLLGGNAFLMTHSSYLILKQVIPTIEPHHLYQIFNKRRGDHDSGVIEGINYGPVGKANDDQYEALLEIVEGNTDEQEPSERWGKVLFNKKKTEDEIIRDVRLGKGNLWVLFRPDRFPIKEAAEATPLPVRQATAPSAVKSASINLPGLPHDIFQILCHFIPVSTLIKLLATSKIIYANLHPHLDFLARTCLLYQEPYYLPGKPISCPRGDAEMQYWNAEWKKAGYGESSSANSIESKLPWFRYARACYECPSMKNRKRIWGIAKQIRKMARTESLDGWQDEGGEDGEEEEEEGGKQRDEAEDEDEDEDEED